MFKFQAQILVGCILTEEEGREFGVKVCHTGPLRSSPEEAVEDLEGFPTWSGEDFLEIEDDDRDTYQTFESIVAIQCNHE